MKPSASSTRPDFFEVTIPQRSLPSLQRDALAIEPRGLNQAGHFERITTPDDQICNAPSRDAAVLVSRMEYTRWLTRQRRECHIPRQAVRDGITRRLAKLALHVRRIGP